MICWWSDWPIYTIFFVITQSKWAVFEYSRYIGALVHFFLYTDNVNKNRHLLFQFTGIDCVNLPFIETSAKWLCKYCAYISSMTSGWWVQYATHCTLRCLFRKIWRIPIKVNTSKFLRNIPNFGQNNVPRLRISRVFFSKFSTSCW